MSEQQQPARAAGRRAYIHLGHELLGGGQRSSPRVDLSLPARCLFADCGEAPATIRDVSDSGLAVDCYRSERIGEPVIIAVDHLGRFDGRIVRHLQTGFAVELRMTPYRREQLRQSVKELAGEERRGEP